jgi:hypothetical protein
MKLARRTGLTNRCSWTYLRGRYRLDSPTPNQYRLHHNDRCMLRSDHARLRGLYCIASATPSALACSTTLPGLSSVPQGTCSPASITGADLGHWLSHRGLYHVASAKSWVLITGTSYRSAMVLASFTLRSPAPPMAGRFAAPPDLWRDASQCGGRLWSSCPIGSWRREAPPERWRDASVLSPSDRASTGSCRRRPAGSARGSPPGTTRSAAHVQMCRRCTAAETCRQCRRCTSRAFPTRARMLALGSPSRSSVTLQPVSPRAMVRPTDGIVLHAPHSYFRI